MLPNVTADTSEKSTYQKWVVTEGIPIIREFYIPDIRQVALQPWERIGGLGVYLNLVGAGDVNDAYLCEIPAGHSLKPQRHLFEELIYVVRGRGATSVWFDKGPKHTFEWQAGSLFSPRLNTWHQHFNGSGNEPARFLAVTTAPVVMNLFHNLVFVFANPFEFRDRYSGDEEYFSGQGRLYPGRIWDSNFIADVKSIALHEWKERGAGARNVMLELSENILAALVSEFPVGTYKKAHRHGPGNHVIILGGTGYSLMWPEGSAMQKYPWSRAASSCRRKTGFTSTSIAVTHRCAIWRCAGPAVKSTDRKAYGVDESVKSGGDQIDYQDEIPQIHEEFEAALAQAGARCMMGAHHPLCRGR